MVQIINALFTIVFQLLEWTLTGIGDLAVSLVSTRRNESYTADFSPAHKLLSKNDDGFVFGDMAITQEQSFSHCLVAGPSGVGKSSCIILNSILRSSVSIFAHDCSGELLQLSSGAKLQEGFQVRVFYYDKPELSEHYNPLDRCRSLSDIRQLSKILVLASLGEGGGNDKFWNSSAENLITCFIRFTKFYAPKDLQNLYNVAVLVNKFASNPKEVDKLFIGSRDDELIEEYKSFVAMDTKLLMNIVATAKASMSLFMDNRIAEITKSTSIELDDLRKNKTIIYLRSDINNLKYYAPLSSLLFEQLFSFCMKDLPKESDMPIYCLLDEMASMYLPMLPIAISNLRKFKVGLMCVVQSESQIISNFGVENARSIIANCFTRVYMPNQPLETCRSLEIQLGKYQFIDDEGVSKTRPLMTMDEIKCMSESIIFVGNSRPTKLSLVPFYKQKDLLRLSQLKPYETKQEDTQTETCVDDENDFQTLR